MGENCYTERRELGRQKLSYHYLHYMSTIKQDLVRGVFWSAVEKYSGMVVSIIVTMVLARLLSPEEYGVVAVATVIISFLQMFCTMGIAPAVIQKELSAKDLDSIFTFSLVAGIIMALLFLGFSWWVADFYGNQLLRPVCQILSIQLLFAAINMVPSALMAKGKKFKEIAGRTLTLQLSSGVVSVIVAWQGAGVYALLISPVFSSVGIFLWNRRYYKVNIDWTFNLEPVKRIFSYSSYQFLFEFVNYFSRNLDKLIIGRAINVDALGIYEKAYRLMQLPMQNVAMVITPVLQPVMRGLENDKAELARKYAKIVRFVATISFPAGVILTCMSEEVIHIFFGERWDAAIPVFSILAMSLPLQMILSTSGAIYLICNNTKMQLWLGIRNTVTTIVGFLIAAYCFRTLESMAWMWTITLILNFLFTYWLMYRHVLCQPIAPMLVELIRPAICSVIIIALLGWLNNVDWQGYLLLAIVVKGISSVGLTLICVQVSGQYDLIKILKSKIKKNNNEKTH